MNANLQDANLQGANLRSANFRGIRSGNNYYDWRNTIKAGTSLEMDLSGVMLYDDEGNAITDDNEKVQWLIDRKAIVGELPADEVQELYKTLKKIWDIEDDEEDEPTETPTEE